MVSRTFSAAEMARRYALVRGMLDAQELEAVVVFGNSGVNRHNHANGFWLSQWQDMHHAYLVACRATPTTRAVRRARQSRAERARDQRRPVDRVGRLRARPHDRGTARGGGDRARPRRARRRRRDVGRRHAVEALPAIARAAPGSSWSTRPPSTRRCGGSSPMRRSHVCAARPSSPTSRSRRCRPWRSPASPRPSSSRRRGLVPAPRWHDTHHVLRSMPMNAPNGCLPAQNPSDRRLERGDVIITEFSASLWDTPARSTGRIRRREPTNEWQQLFDVAQRHTSASRRG